MSAVGLTAVVLAGSLVEVFADPLGIAPDLLPLLDQRASVAGVIISALGLVVAVGALLIQLRAARSSEPVAARDACATWEREQQLARRVLHRLEDHRVLYNPRAWEDEPRVAASIEGIRDYLGEQILQCETTELRDRLRAIQAGLREFLTEREQLNRSVLPARVFSRLRYLWPALTRVRTTVGIAAEEIADVFEIPLNGNLADIVSWSQYRR
ncbi:hypothetical protein ABZ897_62310 [Nonomuraea sp. NPDC046802]|uniref:hypothetical protein n=1 Tax=Nonomuraea sp. NPDC046802 TaxID=3154919 RepID=UPI0033C9202B